MTPERNHAQFSAIAGHGHALGPNGFNKWDDMASIINELEPKKAFLYNGALLYNRLIKTAPDDAIRRYLAFRIMVDAMSFEDLVGQRVEQRLREIRNVFLAHKQNADFFAGYRANKEIRDPEISRLVEFMRTHIDVHHKSSAPELTDSAVTAKFDAISNLVMQKYYADEVAGYRVTNNFLCFAGNHVHEVSPSALAGCFYRYNSSKALLGLAQYLYNNLCQISDLRESAQHAKRDIVLHVINMADCVFKDIRNSHSIDGLREIMQAEGIGDVSHLEQLFQDSAYQVAYQKIRKIRNAIVGHIDPTESLSTLLQWLEDLPISLLYETVNSVDLAVFSAARSNIAIWARYITANTRIPEDPRFRIIDIAGPKVDSYFPEGQTVGNVLRTC